MTKPTDDMSTEELREEVSRQVRVLERFLDTPDTTVYVSRPTIDRSKVISAYTGKQGCMCGCGGNYWYTKAMQEYGGKERGYDVPDDQVNEGMVTRVLNAVQRSERVEVMVTKDRTIYIVDSKATHHRYAIYVQGGRDDQT